MSPCSPNLESSEQGSDDIQNLTNSNTEGTPGERPRGRSISSIILLTLWETTPVKNHLLCKTSFAGHECSIIYMSHVNCMPPCQRPPLSKDLLSHVPKCGLSKEVLLYFV